MQPVGVKVTIRGGGELLLEIEIIPANDGVFDQAAAPFGDFLLDFFPRQEGLDHGIGHFRLFEMDSEARAPAPPILKSRQTSSVASD
jgi:hypothetical protein